MLEHLPKALDKILASSFSVEKSEVDIVRDYVARSASVSPSKDVQVKAGFIHQRPYAMFVSPQTICGRTRCELGDILYVFKMKDQHGDTVGARALFVQVKKEKNDAWQIDPHQLEFWSDIGRIEFQFGKRVYKDGGIQSRIFSGLSDSSELAAYLLLSETRNLGYEIGRVKQRQKVRESTFSIRNTNAITCAEQNAPLCPNHDAHSEMLAKFFAMKIGAEIDGDLAQIVTLVYKRLGWEFDPPEEHADYFLEDGGGFGVVEITHQPERFEVSRQQWNG